MYNCVFNYATTEEKSTNRQMQLALNMKWNKSRKGDVQTEKHMVVEHEKEGKMVLF